MSDTYFDDNVSGHLIAIEDALAVLFRGMTVICGDEYLEAARRDMAAFIETMRVREGHNLSRDTLAEMKAGASAALERMIPSKGTGR